MSLFIETIKIEGGKAFNTDFHNQRMNLTRSHFFRKTTHININNIIKTTPYKKRTKCRIIYNENIISIEYIPYQIQPVTSLKLIEDNTLQYQWKKLDREAITRLSSYRQDCDDILILKNGMVTDTSICNIALFDGKKWITPNTPLLKGTQRENLLKQKIIQEAPINVKDIYKYEQICLFNAMINFEEIVLPTTKIYI